QTISNTIEGFMPQIDSKGISINTTLPKTIVPHDPERISQVISNLVKNSIAAVSKDTGKIEVNLEDSDKEIKVSITDNGTGIPKEKQKELFKKFYQVDASLTRERGGSGLGLAICKGIVESHDGKISAQSEPGVGSTFSFTLPKNQPTNDHRTAI
ncbi:MAG: HAMP domain-containing sensor histidine kinase, partial [Nitrosopumilaceae archaeon]|nr:HAMP domain-containing sensor histidine kinase [Nitrosopumilaceae archaeon]